MSETLWVKYLMLFFCLSCQFSVDFPPKYQDWTATDPLDLFQAAIVKNESNPRVILCKYTLPVLHHSYLIIFCSLLRVYLEKIKFLFVFVTQSGSQLDYFFYAFEDRQIK